MPTFFKGNLSAPSGGSSNTGGDSGMSPAVMMGIATALNTLASLFHKNDLGRLQTDIGGRRLALSKDAYAKMEGMEKGLNAPVDTSALSNMGSILAKANQPYLNKVASSAAARFGAGSGITLQTILSQLGQGLYAPMAGMYDRMLQDKEQNKRLIYNTQMGMVPV